MKKTMAAILAVTSAAVLLAGCSSADVVRKYSQESFANIISTHPSLVTEDKDNEYVLTVDKETLLKISRDYSASDEDIVLSTPIQPFLKAGLVETRLGKGYKSDDANLYLVTDFGSGKGESATPQQALFEAVDFDRSALTYHEELDHYGVVLNGGKFEFAKDYKTNDKDLVFAIAAKPLRDIGVDVNKVDGWTFKTMKDETGKDVDLLLKPYNLK